MGTVEFRVNGTIVASIYFRNEGLVGNDKGICCYYYEYYEPEKYFNRGKVIHKRDDGITALAHTIIGHIHRERQEAFDELR